MSADHIQVVANMIMKMGPGELKRLRAILSGVGGDMADVAAMLPQGAPPKEGDTEVPMKEWPDEYWESQA